MGPAAFCISIDKTYQDTLMPKKRSLIALLILAVSTLTVCCLESNRIYADTDAKFEAFTNTLFQEEVNSNSITLHYTLQNPDNYGISNPIISFGSYSVSSSDISTAAENNLAQLKDIPYAELSALLQEFRHSFLFYYLNINLLISQTWIHILPC